MRLSCMVHDRRALRHRRKANQMLSRVSFYGPDDKTKVACADCNWTGKAGELEAISDFSERVAPGEQCPAGECPACGALAHIVKRVCEDNSARMVRRV